MRTVKDLWERNAHYFPNREALIYGEQRLTHAEFASRARRLASALYGIGLRPRDRFAVLAMNCVEYYEAFAAAEYGGYLLVPLNFRLAPPELAHVLKDSGATVLIYEPQYAATVAALRVQGSSVQHHVCLGPTEADLNYETLLSEGQESGPPVEPEPEDVSVLWYTSGTTGKPKGALWSQRAILAAARMCAQVSSIDGSTRVLQVTPAFHVGGRGYVMGAAWDGGCTVLHRAFDPRAMLATIEREKITHTFMVAAMVQAVLALPDVTSFDLSSLRAVFSAAAPIPVPVLRRAMELMGPVFSLQYGCTEVGSIAALPRFALATQGPPEVVKRLGSAGYPVPEIDFRLVDESGQNCAAGAPGEVAVRSPSMFSGYWNNSGATLEAMREGWYFTGDIGVQDAEGCLYLVDRKKDMIISGGENIYSREVEEALAAHAEVYDCAVIGVPDPKWVESVKAVVVRKPGSTIEEAALIEHCRGLIARYKCPRSIAFVAELPRLATGKIDKPTLRARHASA
jgi:acyl-CoA synthetase (AMP-forming)/AMP-acid ligase II